MADSRTKIVRVYDVAGDGSLKNGREFAKAYGDGLKTDEGGNVWIADEDGVRAFDANGNHLGTVKTPERPSNLNWGAGFRGLYITARTSVYHVSTKANGTRTY